MVISAVPPENKTLFKHVIITGFVLVRVLHFLGVRVRVVVLNASFNNISAISWWSALLVEVTGVPGENHRPAASHWQTLSHNAVSCTPRQGRASNSQRYLWWELIAQVVVYPTTIRSRSRCTCISTKGAKKNKKQMVFHNIENNTKCTCIYFLCKYKQIASFQNLRLTALVSNIVENNYVFAENLLCSKMP